MLTFIHVVDVFLNFSTVNVYLKPKLFLSGLCLKFGLNSASENALLDFGKSFICHGVTE